MSGHWSDAPPDRVLTMPPGPSTNALWIRAPGKPRVRSPEYTTWLHIAGWEVRRQMVGVPMVDCRFNCQLSVPVSRRDSDNWVKAALDLLQHVGVISNDGNLHQLMVTPMVRDDVMVALWMLPEMINVRPPVGARRAARTRTVTAHPKRPGLAWRMP